MVITKTCTNCGNDVLVIVEEDKLRKGITVAGTKKWAWKCGQCDKEHFLYVSVAALKQEA